MSQQYKLSGVYTGKVGERFGMTTAIDKSPITGEIYLSATGLEGDECAR
ncbi:hypothetical protein JCM19238_3687 [Vibrio ponticus]|nr:hypothetical protein JCM19238_3687 [Vibrio ponticus]